MTKIPTRSFYFVCNDAGTFLEVRICITLEDMDYRSCYKTDSDCPGEQALLKDWRDNQLTIKNHRYESDIEVAQFKGRQKDAIYVPVAERRED